MHKEKYDPISHQSAGGFINLDRTSWFDQGPNIVKQGREKESCGPANVEQA